MPVEFVDDLVDGPDERDIGGVGNGSVARRLA
jgi:hypothetical protein